MGYDISEATWRKLEANRRAGRLCAGGVRHCTAPATVRVVQTFYLHKWGEGTATTDDHMVMCGRHARQFPVGYLGANFRVEQHAPLT